MSSMPENTPGEKKHIIAMLIFILKEPETSMNIDFLRTSWTNCLMCQTYLVYYLTTSCSKLCIHKSQLMPKAFLGQELLML